MRRRRPGFESVALLVVRLALAIPFLRAGLTKWDGFLELSPNVVWLFENEYALHFLNATYSFPFPHVFAYASAIGEVVLSSLLIVGLFTRLAALGMLAMTAVIFLTFPANWPNDTLPWAAMALILFVCGGGRLSLDRLFRARWR